MDGFIVWPPSTTRSGPTPAARLSKRRRLPAPATTATTPQTAVRRAAGRARRRAAAPRARASARACSRSRSRSIVPTAVPSESAAPGSSVWTCTFSAESSPTTSSESPSSSSASSSRSRSSALALDDEDGAVAVARELLVDRVGARPLELGRRLGHRLAGDRGGDAAHELEQPRPARVDDARLAQHVELLRRPRDRLLAATDELDEQVAERRAAGRALLGLLGELADHRQHRPLDRPPHRAVGGVGGAPERPGGERRVDPVRRAGEHVGRAADDLGEDHARVAARAHQRAAGDVAGERAPVGRARSPRPPARPRGRSPSGSCRCRRRGRDRR